MKYHAGIMRAQHTPRRAYSLIEVMVSMLIVGGLLVASLRTVGASRLTQHQTTERARAHMLAQGMSEEIAQQPYADPAGGGTIGPESGEASSGTRADFDDVDDYHNWSSTPTARDGTVLLGVTGWTRAVTVAHASATAPMRDAGHDTGVKRITVTVKRGDAVLATRIALRTRAMASAPTEGAIKP